MTVEFVDENVLVDTGFASSPSTEGRDIESAIALATAALKQLRAIRAS